MLITFLNPPASPTEHTTIVRFELLAAQLFGVPLSLIQEKKDGLVHSLIEVYPARDSESQTDLIIGKSDHLHHVKFT